jgi:hypothetical protein
MRVRSPVWSLSHNVWYVPRGAPYYVVTCSMHVFFISCIPAASHRYPPVTASSMDIETISCPKWPTPTSSSMAKLLSCTGALILHGNSRSKPMRHVAWRHHRSGESQPERSLKGKSEATPPGKQLPSAVAPLLDAARCEDIGQYARWWPMM